MTLTFDGFTYDFHIEPRYSPIAGRTLQQLTLAIPGGGCKYWCQTGGKGCTFCGFPGLTRELNLGEGSETNFSGWQLDPKIYERMYREALANGAAAEKLAIFNGGSFFVDSELPPDFRKMALADASRRRHLCQVMVESRPEYVTAAALAEARPVIEAGQDFVVGLGVESASSRVRNKLLKKGMHRTTIEAAFRLMQAHGVKIFAYAFLKAPGLSEKEALADARETLAYLTDLGADEIALSCAFVPPDTPLEADYRAGAFRPPWLWTVVQIVEEAKAQGWPLSVGGFDDNPPPVAIASNCGTCDGEVLSHIDSLRATGCADFSAVRCACRDEWRRGLM